MKSTNQHIIIFSIKYNLDGYISVYRSCFVRFLVPYLTRLDQDLSLRNLIWSINWTETIEDQLSIMSSVLQEWSQPTSLHYEPGDGE